MAGEARVAVNLTTKFKTLMDLSALINSTLDPRQVQIQAIEAATMLVGAETGSLLLFDAVSNELYFEVALGDKGARLKTIRIPADQGIAGWVLQNGSGVIVNDPNHDPRFYRDADIRSQFSTKSLLAAPLRVKGQTIGVLEAINKRDGNFDNADLDLLIFLANQVAPAIENAALYAELREVFHETALTLAEALECRDTYTGGHTRRVCDYSLTIGSGLGLGSSDLDKLKLAAILHDIGKIGVADAILHKAGPLDHDEFLQMRQHARFGSEILKKVRSMAAVIPGVLYHHEKYDGSGYPDALKGETIPLLARIIAVADTYDAMTTDRPYHQMISRENALAVLQKGAGSQFDATIVEAFIRGLKEREEELS
jgi:HD-GYP domain-containing protein (c-di-GMP phosphodiesterase class II)